MPTKEATTELNNDLNLEGLARESYERELDAVAAAGGDRAALDKMGFSVHQLEQIRMGYEEGVDVSAYLDPALSWLEMEESRAEAASGIDMSAYRAQGFSVYQLREIRTGLQNGIDISSFADKSYFGEQMREIRLGVEKSLPVLFYLDPEFNALQMAEIRKGLEENFDISAYARPEIPYMKMRVVREAMEDGLPFDADTITKYDAGILEELRQAHRQGLDLTPYVNEGYNDLQLKQIRLSMAENLYFEPYIRKDMRGESLKEIRLGLEAGVDVSVYADVKYRWRQMRELRLGLEQRLDVSVYANPGFIYSQMREIRKGLARGLDASRYASLVYTAYDMRVMRKKMEAGEDPGRVLYRGDTIPELYDDPVLPPSERPDAAKLRAVIDKERAALRHRLHPDEPIALHAIEASEVAHLVESVAQDEEAPPQADPKQLEREKKERKAALEHLQEAGHHINVSGDRMTCTLSLPRPKTGMVYSPEILLVLMKRAGVVKGVDIDALTNMLHEARYDEAVTVAKGRTPVNGKDGYYEYFFNRTPTSDPELTEEGAASFSNVHFQAEVKVGDMLATYHHATKGTDGFTVTGEVLSARNGIEKPVLRGRGFIQTKDRQGYAAAVSGVVKLDGYNMDINRLLVVEEDVEGGQKIDYLGSVWIKGNVRSGSFIKAQGDIIVDGVAEAAIIESGGDIFFKEGAVGSAHSIVRSEGIVAGKFFENYRVEAKGSIYGNSFLHCNITTEEKVVCFGEHGTIYGGRIDALLGVEAAIVGTRNETKTTICIGVTGDMWNKYNETEKHEAKVRAELDILRKKQAELAEKTLSSREQMQMKIKINAAITVKQKELEDVLGQKNDIVDRIRTVEGAQAMITTCVYAGSVFIIDDGVMQITATKFADERTGRIVFKKGNRRSRALVQD